MNNRGFTLVELLVTVVIFVAVGVPLVGAMGSIITDFRGRDFLTAASLLDRTYASLRSCGEQSMRVDRYKIDKQEWKVAIENQGGVPSLYVITITRGGTLIETAKFYR